MQTQSEMIIVSYVVRFLYNIKPLHECLVTTVETVYKYEYTSETIYEFVIN